MSENNYTFQENATKAAEHGAALQRILKLVGDAGELSEILEAALDIVLNVSWLSLLPKGGVFLADNQRGELQLTAQRALGPEIASRCATVGFGRCLCGRAALRRRTQYAACVDARHETRFEGMQPHGHYNVPILAQGDLLGVLVVYLPERHERDQDEIEFLESIADALAMLILSRRREQALLATRNTLEKTLQDANSLLDVVNQNLIVSHAARCGTIVDVNQALCDISGYARDELIGQPHSILKSGEMTDDFWRDFWETIANGSVWRGEICNRRKDGEVYWVDSIVFPVIGASGLIERYTSIRIDVTERKRAEGSISHLGRILDGSSNEIYIADAKSLVLTQANSGARQNTGYSLEEFRSLTAFDINPRLTPETFAKMTAPLWSGATTKITLESVHRRKDGSEYPVEIGLHLARDESPPVFVAIVNDITDRLRAARRIQELAYFDPLTSLPNRALLMDRLQQALARAERAAKPLKLLFLDLNRFKEINDAHGHSVGDAVLQDVAARFRAQLREAETLARLGGDEFVAILEDADYDDARRVIARLCTALKTPISVEGESHRLSVSVGVASFPEDGATADQLLSRSDIAMYEAKTQARPYCVYSSDMGQRLEKRLETARRLASAIEGDRLQLFYQPLMELGTKRLLGAEALLRWSEPEIGWISPGEFIPIAQERRMMSAIGAWVFEEACRQLKRWDALGLRFPGRLAVNVDAQQIEEEDLHDRLARTLALHGVAPERFEIEITESCMMADRKRAAETMRQIHAKGVTIAVDDFGTGYSSLAYLKEFAIDKLKIDMSFVQDLGVKPTSRPIVAATIAMAHSLGLDVLAEGIETERQAALLRDLGCGKGQGYLLGKPINAAEFATLWLQPRAAEAAQDAQA